jgi:hypothetical protein
MCTRVARWFIFKPKIVSFEAIGMENVYFKYVLRTFGIFYRYLVLCMAIWYGLWSFGIFSPFWYVWTKKNLATLMSTDSSNLSILSNEVIVTSWHLYVPKRSSPLISFHWVGAFVKSPNLLKKIFLTFILPKCTYNVSGHYDPPGSVGAKGF